MTSIFCPQCGELILDARTCSVCGWRLQRSTDNVGEIVWSTYLGDEQQLSNKPYATPTTAAGNYVVITDAGTIVAVDLVSGELVWEYAVDAGTTAYTLTTDGSRVFVGPIDVNPLPVSGRAFLGLDARTGAEAWRFTTQAHSLSAAVVVDDMLYFTSSANHLHAVEAETGAPRWTVDHAPWGAAQPAVAAGILCVGGRGNTIMGYDISDGAKRWQFSAGGWFDTPAQIANGSVYVLNGDGTLYALEVETGDLRWSLRGERGKGLTAPPAVTDAHVFVPSRVYRNDEPAYAILALRAHDGAEVWRRHTHRHILTPPVVADNILFFSSNDKVVYAVYTSDGAVLWEQSIAARVVTIPTLTDELVIVGTRDGTLYAVRWHDVRERETMSPAAYLDQEDYAGAAAAYALRGDYTEAASLYLDKLDGTQEAARLYEKAGKRSEAGVLWEELGNMRRARTLYQEAGDTVRLANLLETMNEPLEAARLHEENGDWAEAARLYEQAGDRPKAAELYTEAGAYNRASRIWGTLGQWENQVRSLTAAGKLAKAAEILEEHEQLERAASLYEKAGNFQRALTLRVQLEHWEHVVSLADAVDDYVQMALAYEQLDEYREAAAAYLRAAEDATQESDVDREHVATLYEHAAALYSSYVFDEEQALACRTEVQRYRKLPDVVVRIKAQKTFVEYEWNTLTLEVRNNGFGPALDVDVRMDGPFDVSGRTDIDGVAPKAAKGLEIFMRPQEGQYGKVPLLIRVVYTDIHGSRYEVSSHAPVRVVQKDTAFDTRTPLEMAIEGSALSGDSSSVGDAGGTQTVRTESADTTDSAYKYDVFISYSHSDSEWVRNWLLPRLEGAGLNACIDYRDFEVGVPSIVNMENASLQSRHVLLVVTPNWVNSEWATFEALMVQTDDPSGLRRRTLPLMLRQSKLPARIALLTHADFTNEETWDTELQRILRSMQAV